MCAFVMKGREGMQGVIKGMVMPTVKKKRILWNKVVQGGKLGKGCLLGNNVRRLDGVGTEEKVIFMQLAHSGDVDR